MFSASTPSLILDAGGFAPRPAAIRAAAHPLFIAFVAFSLVLLSGVNLMSLHVIEPELEKLVGEFSLPCSWRVNPRFGLDQDGRLYLRVYDHKSDRWRDAGLADLARPTIDERYQYELARSRAYSRGSHTTVAQALRTEQRRGAPEFVSSTAIPRHSHLKIGVKTNLLVTEPLPRAMDAPLLDLIEAGADPFMAWNRRAGRMARTRTNQVPA